MNVSFNFTDYHNQSCQILNSCVLIQCYKSYSHHIIWISSYYKNILRILLHSLEHSNCN
uniref:Uncharacterized protein n=1 Tax=Rhizophora mucronata TaxID=61149 RepID=A0A2P2NB46_RHIMU